MTEVSTGKVCSKCALSRPISDFSKDKSKKDGHRPECRDCRKAYYGANRQAILSQKRDYYQANIDEVLAKQRAYVASNPDAIREHRQSEGHKTSMRLWQIRNPEKVNANARNRRAKLRNSEGTHTAEDIALLRSLHSICPCCGDGFTNGFHVDHIIPISRGGSNWPENLTILCANCNRVKHDKTPREFMTYLESNGMTDSLMRYRDWYAQYLGVNNG